LKRVNRRLIANVVVLLAVLASMCLPVMAQDNQDVVTQARQLAYSGKEHREQALTMLKTYLDKQDDADARTLYGTILSWQGRYDEARVQLRMVLANSPAHGDALPAALNVEFWSGHPENADQLARTALAKEPDNVQWMLAEAKALREMHHERDANRVLDRILVVDNGNQTAKEMRREVPASGATEPEVTITHTYDWFSDGRSAQHETSVSISTPTRYGSVIARESRADRFGLKSYQSEIDFYPRIRPGTYGYLNFGYSFDTNLYPKFRVGADLFQSVGHGFELSGGYRYLGFTSGGVNIATFAVSKYYHNFLFTGRGYVVPGSPGTSGTAQFSARYFLGSEGLHDYIEARYSHGASPALAQTTQDIQVLAADSWTLVFDKRLAKRWAFQFSGGAGRSEQVGTLPNLWQYTLSGSLYFKF
jgi:YaiO family outer membrane protein